MIVVVKPHASEQERSSLIAQIESLGLTVHISEGAEHLILGLVGDTSRMNEEALKANRIVDTVMRVQAPYKMASRAFHPENSAITVGSGATQALFGGASAAGAPFVTVIAGPCSVETEAQIVDVAEAVKKSGARVLRGGAFKPRTSPYSFQGLGGDGLRLLSLAKRVTGLPLISELMSINQLDLFSDIDIIQIGARNMQNFDLLKELGACGKPVLLKRGLASTVKELLMSAEYIMAAGNEQVILCERGIRTFDGYTRNTLDLSAVPFLQKETHLPVVVDPSHACGMSWMVAPLAKAAVAAGADGVMVEVHNNPECALCDGEQSLTPAEFDTLMSALSKYAAIEGKTV
jgi:3-deoxy-7-phosphoheptulonate synthase